MKTNMVELEEKINKESLNDERVLNKIIALTKVLNIKEEVHEIKIEQITEGDFEVISNFYELASNGTQKLSNTENVVYVRKISMDYYDLLEKIIRIADTKKRCNDVMMTPYVCEKLEGIKYLEKNFIHTQFTVANIKLVQDFCELLKFNQSLSKLTDRKTYKVKTVEISDIEKLNLGEKLESLLIYYLGTIGVNIKYGVYSEINEEGLSYDDSVRLFIKDISMYQLLTPEEELDLANKYFYDKDESAKEALINHNLRLVLATANRFVGRGLELEDLIQEGSRGLMRSIEKFDPSKGFKLSTYAMWWIRQYIKRGIHDQSRTVRIPVHMHEKIEKMKAIMRKYVIEHEEDASDEYLKKEIGVSDEIYAKLKLFLNDVDSLDVPIKNDEDRNDSFLVDFIEDETQSVQEIAEEHLLSDSIEEAMDNSSLPERTKDIIRMRFGLKPYKRIHTLEETGKVYGITRERTRQIEVKALRRLRNNRTLKELRSR